AAGTKWLHSRILRSPDSLRVGSVNVADGVGTFEAGVGVTASSPDVHPASAAPAIPAPAICKNRRRVISYVFITTWLLRQVEPITRAPRAQTSTRFRLGCGPITVSASDPTGQRCPA